MSSLGKAFSAGYTAGGLPIGSNSANYMWGFFTGGNGGNGQVGDATFAHYSNTNIQTAALSVLKIELNWDGVNERMTYYVNPALDAENSNVPSAIAIDTRDIALTMSDLNRIRPFGGNQEPNGDQRVKVKFPWLPGDDREFVRLKLTP